MKNSYAAIIRNFILFLLLSCFVTGCSIFDPKEEIPCYLHIDSISLSATGTQGSSTSKITEAWIYCDNQLIGGFELPCTVPILTTTGSHHFVIRGGVQMNGNPGTRAMYPFFKGWESDVLLTQGERVTVSPVVTYFPGIDFTDTWMCDFESVGVNFAGDTTYHSLVVRDLDPADVYEGTACGYIHLNSDTVQFIGKSTWEDTLNATKENYLEFNYKGNCAFTVGIVDNSYHYYPWTTVGESETWNKIYIRLTDVIAEAPAGVPYHVYLGMYKPTDVAEPVLYLDNIKLLK